MTVFGPNGLGQDPNTETLTENGTYTVMIEGDVGQSGAAPFNFTVFPVSTTQQTLTLGQTVTGTLATPGSQTRSNFNLSQPTQVLFNGLYTQRRDLDPDRAAGHNRRPAHLQYLGRCRRHRQHVQFSSAPAPTA